MKVLNIITDLDTGGAEMMLYKLMASIDRTRFRPSVISLSDMGIIAHQIEELDIPVISLGMRPGPPTPIDLYRLISEVRHIKPNLIQGWMYHGNLAASIAGFIQKKPVLWNIRGNHSVLSKEPLLTAAVIWLGARFAKSTTHVINNSYSSADDHSRLLGYPLDYWQIIPNGFDSNVFLSFDDAYVSLRTKLNLAADATIIGMVGSYRPMKDHNNFLSAASILQASHPSIQFVLVGKNIDLFNSELQHQISDLKIANNVHLLGERIDIPFITAALDIASSSSYAENFPNVVGEAMLCEVPCVVTDVGDSAWIVGDTGSVVPPRNPEALSAAWSELILMGLDRRKEIGKRARQRIIDNFSIDAVVKKYECLYEEVYSKVEVR